MKRSDLYALAWSQPVTKIAGRFGLSDRGLAKLCERHDIPLPPRGYWARVAAGQKVASVPLPKPDDDAEVPLPPAASPQSMGSLERAFGIRTPTAKRGTRESPAARPKKPVKRQSESGVPRGNFAVFSARGAECDRLLAASMEFERHSAARACLKEIEFRASRLDTELATAVRAWSSAVSETLSCRDPLEEVIQAVRSATAGKQKPLWWPEQM